MRDFIVRVNPDSDTDSERIEVVEAETEEDAVLECVSKDGEVAEVWIRDKTFQYHLNPELNELPVGVFKKGKKGK